MQHMVVETTRPMFQETLASCERMITAQTGEQTATLQGFIRHEISMALRGVAPSGTTPQLSTQPRVPSPASIAMPPPPPPAQHVRINLVPTGLAPVPENQPLTSGATVSGSRYVAAGNRSPVDSVSMAGSFNPPMHSTAVHITNADPVINRNIMANTFVGTDDMPVWADQDISQYPSQDYRPINQVKAPKRPFFRGADKDEPMAFLHAARRYVLELGVNPNVALQHSLPQCFDIIPGHWFDMNRNRFNTWRKFEEAFKQRYFDPQKIDQLRTQTLVLRQAKTECPLSFLEKKWTQLDKFYAYMDEPTRISEIIGMLNPEYADKISNYRITDQPSLAAALGDIRSHYGRVKNYESPAEFSNDPYESQVPKKKSVVRKEESPVVLKKKNFFLTRPKAKQQFVTGQKKPFVAYKPAASAKPSSSAAVKPAYKPAYTTKPSSSADKSAKASAASARPGLACYNCGGPHFKRDCPKAKSAPSDPKTPRQVLTMAFEKSLYGLSDDESEAEEEEAEEEAEEEEEENIEETSDSEATEGVHGCFIIDDDYEVDDQPDSDGIIVGSDLYSEN
jgi:hypothetical protein